MESLETVELASLKRPALQKLCKKLGIKANGKNVDMIIAIEEIRQARSLKDDKPKLPEDVAKPIDIKSVKQASPEVVQDSSPEVWGTPPTSPVAASTKKQGRKKRGRNAASKVKQERPSSPPPSEALTTMLPTAASSAAERLSRKRKRGIDSSPPGIADEEDALCTPSASKQPRLERETPEHAATPIKQERVATPPITPPTSCNESDCDAFLLKTEPLSGSLIGPAPSESTSSTPAGHTPNSSMRRKRNLTFTKDIEVEGERSECSVECEEEQPRPKRLRRSGSEVRAECQEVPQAKRSRRSRSVDDEERRRSRRSTYEIPSHESSFANNSLVGGASDMKDELLDLLEKRVEERKADPNYKPVHTVSTASSRIPVKSAIVRKFDRAHQKNFNKMQSITSSQTRKSTAGSASAKKPRKQSLTSLARAALKSNERAMISKMYKTPGSSNSFKPSVRDTKTTAFNFTANASTTGDKTVSFQPSTLKPKNHTVSSKPLNTPGKKQSGFVASIRTPSNKQLPGENAASTTKKKFDLQASLNRPKPSYKTYTGKLGKKAF